MSFCCEDALAVFAKRKEVDKHRVIVEVTNPDTEFHVYYRSENLIHNLVNSPIPTYVGPPEKAPKEFYGKGTYRVDELLTSVALRNESI